MKIGIIGAGIIGGNLTRRLRALGAVCLRSVVAGVIECGCARLNVYLADPPAKRLRTELTLSRT